MDDGQGAVALREPPEREHNQRGPAQEPGDGRRGPHTPSEALAHHHRQIQGARPGQEWPKRQQCHELALGEPALALDQDTARPERHAAEALIGFQSRGLSHGVQPDFCVPYPLRSRYVSRA